MEYAYYLHLVGEVSIDHLCTDILNKDPDAEIFPLLPGAYQITTCLSRSKMIHSCRQILPGIQYCLITMKNIHLSLQREEEI